MDLQFRIVYKQGATNLAADALSRCQPQRPVSAISTVYFDWLDRITNGYQDDPRAQTMLSASQ